MRRRVLIGFVLLGILGLVVGGMIVPAVAQQKVSAYTTFDEPLAREIMKTFEQETGIKVEWVRLSTGEAVARLEAEKANPQVSIWVGGVDNGHIDAREKGLTVPYASPNAKAIPAAFKDKDGYWTGLYVAPLTFASNTNLLKKQGLKAPDSWAELLKPEWKGKIQISNPGSSGTAYNVITTLIFLWGEEKAFTYLKDLHKNVSQYTRSGSAPGKAAALGETVVGIGYAHDQVKLKAEGYPIQISPPGEGTGYEIASVSLIKGGKQPELAKKLYDWVLSKKAATVFAGFFVTPLVDAPLSPHAIPLGLLKTVNQDNVWGGKNKKRLVEKWNNEVFASR